MESTIAVTGTTSIQFLRKELLFSFGGIILVLNLIPRLWSLFSLPKLSKTDELKESRRFIQIGHTMIDFVLMLGYLGIYRELGKTDYFKGEVSILVLILHILCGIFMTQILPISVLGILNNITRISTYSVITSIIIHTIVRIIQASRMSKLHDNNDNIKYLLFKTRIEEVNHPLTYLEYILSEAGFSVPMETKFELVGDSKSTSIGRTSPKIPVNSMTLIRSVLTQNFENFPGETDSIWIAENIAKRQLIPVPGTLTFLIIRMTSLHIAILITYNYRSSVFWSNEPKTGLSDLFEHPSVVELVSIKGKAVEKWEKIRGYIPFIEILGNCIANSLLIISWLPMIYQLIYITYWRNSLFKFILDFVGINDFFFSLSRYLRELALNDLI
jgi:hypothetical protein